MIDCCDKQGPYATGAVLRCFLLQMSAESGVASIQKQRWQNLDFEIIRRKLAKLQDIPAVQLITQYKQETTAETMISEQLIALRQETKEDSGIIYIFRLDTPKSRYKEDRNRFKQIIHSWRKYSETAETGLNK